MWIVKFNWLNEDQEKLSEDFIKKDENFSLRKWNFFFTNNWKLNEDEICDIQEKTFGFHPAAYWSPEKIKKIKISRNWIELFLYRWTTYGSSD